MAAKEGAKKILKFVSSVGHIKDRVVFHQNPEIPKEGILLGLNGVHFQVKPGVEVDIPRPVRQMVDTLIFTDLIQDEEGGEYTRDRPRYPYSLIKEDVGRPADNSILPGLEPENAGAAG